MGLTQFVEHSQAVRAAANAIANNPISYLIPCHRVIRKSGKIHKYRWGIERKKAILAYEAQSNFQIPKKTPTPQNAK